MSYSEDFTILTAQPTRTMRARQRFDPETSPFEIKSYEDGRKEAVLKEGLPPSYGPNYTATFVREQSSALERDSQLFVAAARGFRSSKTIAHEQLKSALKDSPTLEQLAAEKRLTVLINEANGHLTPRAKTMALDVLCDLFPMYPRISISRMTRRNRYKYPRKSDRDFKHTHR